MLVLSRDARQRVIIGEGPAAVVVTVVEVSPGGRVRLGFEAPGGVSIDREEVRIDKLQNGARDGRTRHDGPTRKTDRTAVCTR